MAEWGAQLNRKTSGRGDWQTPPDFFAYLDLAAKGFQVDAAADSTNHLMEPWYGPGSPLAEDALTVDRWLTPAFCNPPYGKGIERWLEKFIEQSRLGGEVVALLPANTDTQWWATLVVPHADIVFLTGRLPFMVPGRVKPSQPPHGSAVVLYHTAANGEVGWMDWRRVVADMKAHDHPS